jgi:hypothetical protein
MTLAYLGDSGIVLLGGDVAAQYDDEGVRWQWSGDEPWTPGPEPRSVTGDNSSDHGSWDGTKFYGPRSYELKGKAFAPTHEALHRAKRRLAAACGIRPFDLRVLEPGFDRFGSFRRDGRLLWTELTNNPSSHVAQFSVPLWAKDPRAYSTQVRTASTGFPTTTGGLNLPTVVPFLLDAVTTTGEMVLLNDGNETAWPVYRIDPGAQPVVDPAIVDATTGQAMRFAITINPGEWLTIDTHTHRVLGNGDPQANRRVTFHGDWFGLEPGTTPVRFAGASGAGSTLSASWRDTDI